MAVAPGCVVCTSIDKACAELTMASYSATWLMASSPSILVRKSCGDESAPRYTLRAQRERKKA